MKTFLYGVNLVVSAETEAQARVHLQLKLNTIMKEIKTDEDLLDEVSSVLYWENFRLIGTDVKSK